MQGGREIISMLTEAHLNKEQRAFCRLSMNKNIRLLAPAGAGKTFSILWRCKALVDSYQFNKDEFNAKGIPAPKFLIVAFTRTARHELETRIENTAEFHDLNATVRTLNAWGWEQIRIKSKELAVNRSQKVAIITHDLNSVCNKYPLINAAIETKNKRTANAAILMDTMDAYKSLGFTHKMKVSQYRAHKKYLKEIGLDEIHTEYLIELNKIIPAGTKASAEDLETEFFKFFKEAVPAVKANNRFTLEDQKYWTRINFEEQTELKHYPSGVARYTHIIVDEFQDVNPLDMALIKAACLYHGHGKPLPLCIVGDDDQAIFGWRGTTPKYILDPEKYFGVKFETCVLQTVYRSPKEIVELSNKLLSYNKQRVPKEIKSLAKGKATIKLIDDKQSVSTIDATMKLTHKLLEKGCKNVALISRRQISLFPYQVLFSAENTPYHVAVDLDIFEGEATQSLVEIMRIIYRAKINDCDDPVEAILTIADKIDRFKISSQEKEKIASYLEDNNTGSFNDVLEALNNYPRPIKSMEPNEVYILIRKMVDSKSVSDFMGIAIEELRGLDKDYLKAEDDLHYKSPQFFRLADLSQKYGNDYRRFIIDIEKAKKAGERSRRRDSDDSSQGYKERTNTQIHLLTATRAKGLEFDAVIILDADDNEWPNRLSGDIEEERRLFHVAMSRAKKYLYFVTDSNKLWSRFLLETRII